MYIYIYNIVFGIYLPLKVSLLQVGRVRTVKAEGVKEIWLSSEDTGAYGIQL